MRVNPEESPERLMSKNTAEPGLAQAFVELRRARIRDGISRDLQPVGASAEPLAAEKAGYLLREAEELYWNELAWEQMTDEEAISGGHLTELVFPGFLALIDGLLARGGSSSERRSGIRAHPDAVEDILAFLGERAAELTAELRSGADSQKVVWARSMTLRLIDLVLYRLYGLTPAERERLDALA